ncbi:hypothetical protein KCU71_g71, partial [Aureobasidium melanogenum]
MKRAGRSEGPLAGGDGLRLLALDGPSLAGLLFMLVTCTEQRPSRPCRLAKRNQGSGSCCACVHETACAVAAGKHRAAVRLRAPNSPGGRDERSCVVLVLPRRLIKQKRKHTLG